MKEGYEEELVDYSSDNCPESKIFVASYPLPQGGFGLEVSYSMADIETTLSGMEISHPKAMVTEGFLNPSEGSSTPCLSIPSPFDLLAWNNQRPTTKALQGGEGLGQGFQEESLLCTVELHRELRGPAL